MKKFLATLVGCVVFITFSSASAQIVWDKLPLLTYAEVDIKTYDAPDGKRIGIIRGGKSLVMVKKIRGDGWAYGSYQIGNRRKRVNSWFKMKDLQGYLDFGNYAGTVKGDTDAHRTRTSNNLVGKVASREEITVVAERGDRVKVIFMSDGGKYRMGWITRSNLRPLNSASDIVDDDDSDDTMTDISDVDDSDNTITDIPDVDDSDNTITDIPDVDGTDDTMTDIPDTDGTDNTMTDIPDTDGNDATMTDIPDTDGNDATVIDVDGGDETNDTSDYVDDDNWVDE